MISCRKSVCLGGFPPLWQINGKCETDKKMSQITGCDNNWTSNNKVDRSMGRIPSAGLGLILFAVIPFVHFYDETERLM